MSAELKPKTLPGEFSVRCPKCGLLNSFAWPILLHHACGDAIGWCDQCNAYLFSFDKKTKVTILVTDRVGPDGSELPDLCGRAWQKH